ncbi:MAG: RNase adapter RapZ [Deltaproteobacteria bacterium]|nr:RNase adapter RapZ [Deltaproteobacteria bacterium]
MVVVVTGLSGAGRTTTLRALEDLGFFCIDNLPTALAPDAVSLCEKGGVTRVALGIDVRVREFLGEVGNVLSLLDDGGRRDLHVLFLDASDETILRRFSETRRPHPLASTGSREHAASVLEGVALERERLSGVRARATRVVDTSNLSVHELRRAILAAFGPASGTAPRMSIRIMSFGFKYGPPVDADILFDVRFLKNPYFVPELKRVPGTDARVRDYVMGLPETPELIDRTLGLLEYVVPKYEREGKSYLTIAFGCTGGMHRSVVLAEHTAAALDGLLHERASRPRMNDEPTPKIDIAVVHRDIGRADIAAAAKRPPSLGEGQSVLPPSLGLGAAIEHGHDLGNRGVK